MTVGELRKIIKNIDDDFVIEMRVRRRKSEEEIIKSKYPYPYPYNTAYTELEFDDIGYSDKQLCLGCVIRIRGN